MSTSNVYKYKIVFLGETSVGKSSITARYVQEEFNEFQEPTIGAAFLAKTVETDNGTIKFEIWDTAGQERYNALAPMYYRGANVAIVVYDVTNPDTLSKAKSWVNELKIKVDNIYIVLVGNKCDLGNKINNSSLEEYLDVNQINHYLSSAKENINIENIFNDLAKILPCHVTNNENNENNKLMYAENSTRSLNKNQCC